MAIPTIDPTQRPGIGARHVFQSSSGFIEVLRITRPVKGSGAALSFAGIPGSGRSGLRGIEVSFVDVEGFAPAPVIDAAKGLVRLFYPLRQRMEVERLLSSRRDRFCYFWRSHDGVHRRAWLISSP